MNSPRLPILNSYSLLLEVVNGKDPRAVTYDNLEGYSYKKVWVAHAVSQTGYRFQHPYLFPEDQLEACTRFTRKIARVGSIDSSLWREISPVYGSIAWEQEQIHHDTHKESF